MIKTTIAALVAMTTAAHASGPLVTAAELLEGCRKGELPTEYVKGVWDGHLMTVSLMGKRSLICLPPELTVEEYAATVCEHLENNPEIKYGPSAVIQAFGENYMCSGR